MPPPDYSYINIYHCLFCIFLLDFSFQSCSYISASLCFLDTYTSLCISHSSIPSLHHDPSPVLSPPYPYKPNSLQLPTDGQQVRMSCFSTPRSKALHIPTSPSSLYFSPSLSMTNQPVPSPPPLPHPQCSSPTLLPPRLSVHFSSLCIPILPPFVPAFPRLM